MLVGEWLPLLPVFDLPQFTGEMLEGVVRRKSATAGGLDGWRWRELRFCQSLGLMALLLLLPMLKILVFGLMGCWMLTLP